MKFPTIEKHSFYRIGMSVFFIIAIISFMGVFSNILNNLDKAKQFFFSIFYFTLSFYFKWLYDLEIANLSNSKRIEEEFKNMSGDEIK